MNLRNTIIENLVIESAAAEGNCVARHDGKVIFVKYAVPGDIANVLVTKDKKSFSEAEVVSLVKASPQRREPHCEHFGICGGCKWQHMSYEAQLHMKQQWVDDAMRRIGGISGIHSSPIIGAPLTEFYRNKLDYTFSNKRWLTGEEMQQENLIHNALGFHVPGRFDKVIDISKCWHQPEPSNSIRLAVKKFCLEFNYPFFDLKKQEGFVRNLVIRNTLAGEWMVILSFFREDEKKRKALLDHLLELFPAITSLYYVINGKKNETFHDLDLVLYAGQPYITEEMEGLRFRVQPKSFFQTNTGQALNLYRKTIELAGFKGDELLYDLYTGTGTIALYAAGHVKKVVGLEYVEQAIEDAKVNAEINDISNAHFFAGDIKKLMNDDFIAEHGRPDVVITDPPRAGMHEDVVKKLVEVRPERIVYVSCNPATQARDLALMSSVYQVKSLQPVDMFPHTSHVENIALLEL